MSFESIVKSKLSSSGEYQVEFDNGFESIVKSKLSSSDFYTDKREYLFESIVKSKLSSSWARKGYVEHCLRVLLNLNYLHPAFGEIVDALV